MALLLVLLASPFTSSARAQDRQDLEYREVTLEEQEKKTDFRGRFETGWYEYNNLDFRPLDESSDQSILDSDDRGSFAFTGIGFEVGHQIEPNLRFVLAGSHRGLWGDDQFGNVNAFGGFLYFNAAYIDAAVAGQKPVEERVRFRVGRQFYQIGGLGGAPDYVLADVLDMVRVDIPLGSKLNVVLIPANLFAAAADTDGANFVSYIGQTDPETYNFRGDMVTRRHGLVLEATELGPVEARGYFFTTDLGAAGTGSDISYDGLLGNFSDNDFVHNWGVRAQATFGPLTPYLHLDGSAGLDRKEEVAQDVNCNGWAFGGGLSLDTRPEEGADGLTARVSYFDAFGPAYEDNGLLFSHGYVGMKAQQSGGIVFNRFLGFHPTAYVSRTGITNNPQDMSRKAGTREIHAEVGGDLPGPLFVQLGWWMLGDTGLSAVDFRRLDRIVPPYGYSRSEFAAQERLGTTLGHELNLDLVAHASPHFDVFATAGGVFGTQFYTQVIDRTAGDALGSANPALPWVMAGGTRVVF